MHIAAQAWYSSGTLWSITGVAVAVAAAVAATWAAFVSANPRRELSYLLLSSGPLVSKHADSGSGIEVSLDGEKLDHAHLAEVRIRNSGRRDIPTAAFDAGRAFLLEAQAPVLKVVRVDSTPGAYLPPPIGVDGTRITVGPALLKKGQEVRIVILTDQLVRVVEPVAIPLINVKVRRSGSDDAWLRRTMLAVAPFALGGLYPIVGFLLKLPPVMARSTTALGGSLVVLGGCETVLLLAVFRRIRQMVAHHKVARP